MRKIIDLESLVDSIMNMMSKYCGYKPSELDRREIMAEFINDCDCAGWLEDLPLNEETYPIFEYIFINYEAHGKTEKNYMKMVFNPKVSFQSMWEQAYSEYSDYFDNEETDIIKTKSKFKLYSFLFDKENWLGLDKYINSSVCK